MAHTYRRVLTGHNEDGRSIILSDATATTVKEMKPITGLVATDLWETRGAPASNAGDEDAADRPVALEPPQNGTVFRMVEFPPDTAWSNDADAAAAFATIGAAHVSNATSSDPLMHRTNSVDYLTVVKGEIWAVMEEGEVCLKEGDIMVQRGTNHSWSVRTEEPCLVSAVLVSAEPL